MSDASCDLRLEISLSHDTDRRSQGKGQGGLIGDLSDTLQPFTVPQRLSGLLSLGRTEWNEVGPGRLYVHKEGGQLGRRHKAPERKLLCVIVTLSFAKASRQAFVSEVRPVQVAECHGPPVCKRSGQWEETVNMRPAAKAGVCHS